MNTQAPQRDLIPVAGIEYDEQVVLLRPQSKRVALTGALGGNGVQECLWMASKFGYRYDVVRVRDCTSQQLVEIAQHDLVEAFYCTRDTFEDELHRAIADSDWHRVREIVCVLQDYDPFVRSKLEMATSLFETYFLMLENEDEYPVGNLTEEHEQEKARAAGAALAAVLFSPSLGKAACS